MLELGADNRLGKQLSLFRVTGVVTGRPESGPSDPRDQADGSDDVRGEQLRTGQKRGRRGVVTRL